MNTMAKMILEELAAPDELEEEPEAELPDDLGAELCGELPARRTETLEEGEEESFGDLEDEDNDDTSATAERAGVAGAGPATELLASLADAPTEAQADAPSKEAPAVQSRRARTLQMPLTPLVLTSIASSYVGHEQYSHSPTPWVRSMLSAAGAPADGPWGVAWVSYVGHASHVGPGMTGSTWPLPRVGSADELAEFAEQRRVLFDAPEVADVALIWSPAKGCFVNAGVVVEVISLGGLFDPPRSRVTSVEANVTRRGDVGGRGIHRVSRVVERGSMMRFIRWVMLDPREAAGDPVVATRMAAA